MLLMGLAFNACRSQDKSDNPSKKNEKMEFEVIKTVEKWKEALSPEEYNILRQCGTEYAFTGKYYLHFENGIYHCKACNSPLFSSETKYKSGSGWPSFYKPINDKAVKEIEDKSNGMVRTEIVCAKCGGHLGHVFPDGPKPTRLRYCVNLVFP